MHQQLVFGRADAIQTDRVHVIERGAEADEPGYIRRAGFELVWGTGECRLFETDGLDHLAATEKWRHRGEMFLARPQHAGAGRREQFVAGEGVEIATERLYVDGKMRRALRTIDEQRDASCPASAGDLAHGIDRAEHVGHMHDAGELHVWRESLDEFIENEFAVLRNRRGDHARTGARGDELPRHDVGVVFHRRDQDFVT